MTHSTLTGSMACPLCLGEAPEFCADRSRRYFRCPDCELAFADPGSHLTPEQERAEYDLHENDSSDIRYRASLSRLADPLLTRLEPGMQGLDYGCGPGPTLSRMLAERGMAVDDYDPIYAADTRLLQRTYDFVTTTEVVEHFCRPAEAWRQLASLVRPGGWLGVMTLLAPESADEFSQWWYKNDPTHVSFYTENTFGWLADSLGFSVEALDDRVLLMQRV
jgi:SAM-dependent methyltransferase